MKRLIYVLIFLLLLFALFMTAMLGASHRINLKNSGTLNVLLVVLLHTFTALSLVLFVRTKSIFAKWLATFGIVLTIGSVFSYLYIMSSMRFNDGGIMVPISILIAMLVLCVVILYRMIIKPKNGDE